MKPFPGKWLLPALLSVLTFFFDCLSKDWANSHLNYGESSPFIPFILRLTLTHNAGAAFGIGRSQGLLMTVLASAILTGIIIWMCRREKSDSPPNAIERCGVGIIVGGALGNLFDRLIRHQVTDFLEFAFFSFPVFNVADAMINVGAALVIIGAFAGSAKSGSKADGN